MPLCLQIVFVIKKTVTWIPRNLISPDTIVMTLVHTYLLIVYTVNTVNIVYRVVIYTVNTVNTVYTVYPIVYTVITVNTVYIYST